MSDDLLSILFFAGLAAFVLIKLRSVLGQDVGSDDGDDKHTSYGMPHAKSAKSKSKKNNAVVAFPPSRQGKNNNDIDVEDAIPLLEHADEKSQEALNILIQKDPEFDLEEFHDGAKAAFEMIILAFANADMTSIQSLLSEKIYTQFDKEVEARSARGQRMENTLVGIDDLYVTHLTLNGSAVAITVSIVSEQVPLMYDDNDTLVSGNTSNIQKLKDVWMFERDITSDNPNWVLASIGQA